MTEVHIAVQIVSVDRNIAMCVYTVQFELHPFCSPSSFAPDEFSLLTDPAGLLQAANHPACSGWCVFGYKNLDTLIVIYFYT